LSIFIIQEEESVKSIKYLILGAVGVFILFTADRVTAERTEEGDIRRAIIKIDTLSCGGCFNTISQGLSQLKGYSGMGMNLFRKRIAVDFTEPLTEEEITRTLSQVGYPGTVETVEAVPEKESFAYPDQKRAGAGPGQGSCCILPNVLQPAEKL
jgi:copper chaperone CopZ